MLRKCAVVIGDSHYGAVANGAAQSILNNADDQNVLAIFNAWKYNLNYEYCIAEDGKWVLNPNLVSEIGSLALQFDELIIFSMFGGGHNHVLSLLRHPDPFDFYAGDFGVTELDPQAKLLPRSAVGAVMQEMIQGAQRNMLAIRHAFGNLRYLHIESPPPNGDNFFIRENMGDWFETNFTEAERKSISSPAFRLKCWLLHSQLYKEFCAKSDIGFMPVPIQGKTAEGYLLPEYFGGDATHASADYGTLIIRQIENLIDVKFDRWQPFG